MYLKQLTFTRFLAAIWVVLYHNEYIFKNPSVSGFIKKGNLGVSYFFVLSGFVMIIAYFHSKKTFNTKDFYVNRIARIYPVYLFATLLSILLDYLLFSKTHSFLDSIVSIFVLQAFFAPFSSSFFEVFGLGWSLTTEFVFYALFPLLLKKVYYNKRFTLFNFVVAITFFWIFSISLSSILQNLNTSNNPRFHDFIFHLPIWHINQFLIGNLFGLLYLRFKEKKPAVLIEKYSDLLLFILLLALITSLKILPFWPNKYIFFPYAINVHNGFLAYLFGAFLYVLSVNNSFIKKIFSLPFLILLGEISYSIYLLQGVVKYLANWQISRFEMNLSVGMKFCVYIFSLLLISYLTHIFIEKPGLKIVKNYLKNKNLAVPLKET